MGGRGAANERDGVDERLRAEAYVCLAAHVGLISELFPQGDYYEYGIEHKR
jgi:hypothetical protein